MEFDPRVPARALRASLGVCFCLVCRPVALAADAPPPLSKLPAVGFMQVAIALALVLAAIVLFAWLLRRWVPGYRAPGGLLRVVAGVMIGPRERLVLVELEDTWLLVGVASGGVNILHTMPKPANAAMASPTIPGDVFSRIVRQAVARRRDN
ncbi:MAG: flagellar biosynthetic protein FliO [Betaproteobacteria bacterium]